MLLNKKGPWKIFIDVCSLFYDIFFSFLFCKVQIYVLNWALHSWYYKEQEGSSPLSSWGRERNNWTQKRRNTYIERTTMVIRILGTIKQGMAKWIGMILSEWIWRKCVEQQDICKVSSGGQGYCVTTPMIDKKVRAKEKDKK